MSNDANAPIGARRFRVDPQLRRNAGPWVEGLVHDLKQPIAKLQAFFHAESNDPMHAAAAAAFSELSFGLNELFSITQAGIKEEIDGATVDLQKLMQVVAAAARPSSMIDSFIIDVDPTDIWVFAVQAWLYRILTNLVNNAIKHSQGQRVTLRARLTPRFVEIDVEDDGHGMRKDVLFAINRLGHTPATTAASGIETVRGVGISTAIQLARALGGELFPIDQNRRGTLWRLQLPASLAQAALSVEQSSTSLAGKTVMVLDDQLDIAKAVGRRFAALGAEVHVHDDDTDLLVHAIHLGKPVDLFVLDFMLQESTVERLILDLSARQDGAQMVILTGKPALVSRVELQPRLPIFSKPLRDEDFAAMLQMLQAPKVFK